MAEGRFVLVYHEDLIANYGEVWHDDRLLANWLRLFALADKLWPSPAAMPRGVRPSVVKALTGAGLIELLPNDEYAVRGLDAHRRRKAEQARNAANSRYGNAQSSAESSASTEPTAVPHADGGARPQSESASLSENVGELGYGEEGDDAVVTYHTLTGRFPTGRVKDWLTELVGDFKDDAVSRALAAEMIADRSMQTLLSRTESRLRLASHEAEKRVVAAQLKAEEEERERIQSMPEEQRAANLARLQDMMAEKGLLPRSRTAKPE